MMYNITLLICYIILWLWYLWQSCMISYYFSSTKSKIRKEIRNKKKERRIRVESKKDLNNKKWKRDKAIIFDSDITPSSRFLLWRNRLPSLPIFFLTLSDILFQISYHLIHTILFLLYNFLVALSLEVSFFCYFHPLLTSDSYTCYKPLPSHQVLCYFPLLSILSTFHSFFLSTSTSFSFSVLYFFTGFLYLITQLTFTTRSILIIVGSFSLIVLVNTTSLIVTV